MKTSPKRPTPLHLTRPVIPVLWDSAAISPVLEAADMIFLQGGSIAELDDVLSAFDHPITRHKPILLNLDLLAGLSADEAALTYLSNRPLIRGIITTRHHLVQAAHNLGLQAIVRIFLQDSRAVDRGIHVARHIRPEAIELLPGIAASEVITNFSDLDIPILAGGLIRTPEHVQHIRAAGCTAVSTSRPQLWELNQK